MFAYSLYLVLRLTIVQQPVCTSKQPPSLRNLLVWNTITANKPLGINRVANIDVKYANAPNTATKLCINQNIVVQVNSDCESANEVYLIQRKKFRYLTKIWKLQIPI